MSAGRARSSSRRPAPSRLSSPTAQWYRTQRTVVAQRTHPGAAVARAEPNLHTIVLIDITGSGLRDCQGQRRMRDDLYTLVDYVAAGVGIGLNRLRFDDKGDGLRLVVPLDLVPPTRIVDFFVAGLSAGLREHRRYARPEARLRMRVCFDLGLVEAHRQSWSGEVLIRAARLVDAEPVREVQRADPELDLVAVVSDQLYDCVLRHRFGHIAPDRYREIHVHVKEFEGRAWLLLP